MSITTIDLLVLDYIILIISFIFTVFSFWKGFINSILGLLTWIGSVFITIFTYEPISDYLYKIIINFEFLSSFEQFVSIISFLISIPLIFLFSLFILKKLRRFISSDLDQRIFGKIMDKFFGIIYGVIFSYAIFSSILYLSYNNNLNYVITFNNFIIEN